MSAITKTTICNMSLALIGARYITNIDDGSKEARLCKTFYDQARRSTLADFDWNFARKELALAEVDSDDYSGWDFAYSYPADSVEGGFRKIYRLEPTSEKIKFEIRSNAAGTRTVILTDEEDAVGIYTSDVEITGRFTPKFVDALVLKLASILAYPLKSKQSKVDNLMQRYSLQLAQSKALSANEGAQRNEDHNVFKAARA